MRLNVRETVTFGMLGAAMYASKLLMDAFPNVHLLGVFVIALTVVYRKKALYPIYTFIFITGLFAGFAMWWLPYLYLWLILWAAAILLPKNIPSRIKPLVYMCICALHGFLYGTLYAPAQALLFGLNFDGMITWILAGLPWDFIHGVSNFCCGILICPMIAVLKRSELYLKN